MRTLNRLTCTFACAVVCLGSAAALGGDGLTITIHNDSGDNLLVTVDDQSTQPPQRLLVSREIYGNASITVSMAPGAAGRGHVSWRAVSADPTMRKCGHHDEHHLSDGDIVNVHADEDCAAR
jgi:hypothetical protein